MRKLMPIIFLALTLAASSQGMAGAKEGVDQGDFFLLSLPYEQGLKVEFSKSHTEIKSYKKNEKSIGLVPVHYSTPPGIYPLKVYRGDKLIYEDSVEVREADFEKSYITVDKKMNEKKSEKNVRTMINHARDARANPSEEKLWEDEFVYPTKGRVSSPFGATRYVNNKVSGYHSGTDFAVPIGTDVVAVNSGRVVLAMYLNSTGNTIIIDHGQNLFSSYSHLDSLEVEKGDMISKEELIGRSGNTGFTTGPHLHFTMSIGNTFVDPFLFIDKIPF